MKKSRRMKDLSYKYILKKLNHNLTICISYQMYILPSVYHTKCISYQMYFVLTINDIMTGHFVCWRFPFPPSVHLINVHLMHKCHLCTFQNESYASISYIWNLSSPPSLLSPLSLKIHFRFPFLLCQYPPSPTHMDDIKNAPLGWGEWQQTSEITFRLDLDLIKTLLNPMRWKYSNLHSW